MDTKKLDLNLLLTLEALLAELNVTKAAERLHLSQPAVSAQLNRLRTLFRDPLLIPGRRGMIPTAKALELMVPLSEALEKIRFTLNTQDEFTPEDSALTATLSCTDYIQVALIKPLINVLREVAPGIRIAIRNYDPRQSAYQLVAGQTDLVIATPETAYPSLRTQHLFYETYVLVGSAGHTALKEKLTMEEFCQLEHIIVSPVGGGFTTPVDELLAESGLKRNIVLSAASFLFIPAMVATSRLVALVPRRFMQESFNQLSVVEVPWLKERFEVSLIWHERNHGHVGYRWLRELILKLSKDENISSLPSHNE
ncbi:LysR family transcriptional regulator [Citrobacter sp. R56]|uniref:LysR family transcriptional regulator n=1 Tax=Citrobacter sp. R56 TaxID=1573676 RepID=UPI00193B3846|nr:LysR family transcriptional regulator [Citrobacter sp. R56]QRG81154.1 LysR family transcriptional regulator [Citrobacter sp. R56]